MKFKDIIAGASILCLASVVSCNKDMDGNLSESGKIVSLSVNSAQTDISKTWVNAAIGESVLPVYWSNGDMIAVNGIVSNALELDPGEKASSAVFKVRNVSAPYYVLYPATGMESIDEDYRMKVIIPGEQNYVEDSFDNGRGAFALDRGYDPRSIYATCCILKYLVNVIKPNNNFALRLRNLIDSFTIVSTEAEMGFPPGWKDDPFWRVW